MKTIPLTWTDASSYWLCLRVPEHPKKAQLADMLKQQGIQQNESAECYCIQTGQNWKTAWSALRNALERLEMMPVAEVAVIAGDAVLSTESVSLNKKSAQTINGIADALWLATALQEGRVHCSLQPVLDKRSKVFGYESFARATTQDGTLIFGGAIIAAAKALNIEHLLDRYLHAEAIATFVKQDCAGMLFINFVPGFIHRPEVYLENLTEAAETHKMPARQLVLDFTYSSNKGNIAHLKRIIEYCRSRGYAAALDDIDSTETAQTLMKEIKPDFLKLDIQLVKRAAQPLAQKTIEGLASLAHSHGCTLLAEGVETEEIHQILLKQGVDLFQGYLFSPPEKQKKAGGAAS